MATETVLQAEPALAELADQFAQWRQTRRAHEPIPPRLWTQAVTLTALLPYTRVAQRLCLRPRELKKRCLARPGLLATDAAPSPLGFIELTGFGVDAAPAPGAAVIEVERPDGARLRLQYRDAPPLAAVLRAFLTAA